MGNGSPNKKKPDGDVHVKFLNVEEEARVRSISDAEDEGNLSRTVRKLMREALEARIKRRGGKWQ